jgi:hypothetical protein
VSSRALRRWRSSGQAPRGICFATSQREPLASAPRDRSYEPRTHQKSRVSPHCERVELRGARRLFCHAAASGVRRRRFAVSGFAAKSANSAANTDFADEDQRTQTAESAAKIHYSQILIDDLGPVLPAIAHGQAARESIAGACHGRNRQAPCRPGPMQSVQSVAQTAVNTRVLSCGFHGFRGENQNGGLVLETSVRWTDLHDRYNPIMSSRGSPT